MTRTTDGRYRVGVTGPVGITGEVVAIFRAAGPFIPTGFPDADIVDDYEEWLARHRRAGFTFTPVPI